MLKFLIFSIFFIPQVDRINDLREFHEFHLSKCEVEFNNDEKTLEIAIQLFIDDTESALSAVGHDSLRLFSDKEDTDADQIIHSYLQDHFIVFIDAQRYKPTWLGKEISDDLAGLWCYMTIDNVDPTDEITISNDVLMEVFDDQRNIVKLKYNKKNKAYFLFDSEEYTGLLKIKS